MLRPLLTLLLFVLLLPALLAQKKEPPKKEPPPKIVVVPQLGIDAGKTTKLTVRGLRLDNVTEVQLQEPKATGKVVGKGRKVAVPNNADPNRVGDSEIEIEVSLPPELPGRTVPFSLVGPGGESQPHQLIVNDDTVRTQEKEPNDGFRQAQPIAVPSLIEGKIHEPQNVDVYRFEGKSGDEIAIDLQARQFGSPLDPILYLYDAANQLLATAEANANATDPTLKFKLPRDGSYYVALLDGHDQGGSIFVYRLHLTKQHR